MSYYIKAEALPCGASTRVLGPGALLLPPPPRAVEQTVVARAWHLHVQGPRQPGLVEVALFVPFGLLFMSFSPARDRNSWDAGKNPGSARAHPPTIFQRLSMPSGNWGASGPKCSHAELETGFSSKRPQQNLPASFIHRHPHNFCQSLVPPIVFSWLGSFFTF